MALKICSAEAGILGTMFLTGRPGPRPFVFGLVMFTEFTYSTGKLLSQDITCINFAGVLRLTSLRP